MRKVSLVMFYAVQLINPPNSQRPIFLLHLELLPCKQQPDCKLSVDHKISQKQGDVPMARQRNDHKLDDLSQAIQAHPDQKAGYFARLLDWDNKSVMRALPQLEDRGDLLMEDDNGRIGWFGRRR